MTFRTLIVRSLRHHWRAHLGVVLGAAVGSAALMGALVVGDSVRESLRRGNLEKLGGTGAAILGNDRFFSAGLERRIQSAAIPLWLSGALDTSRGAGAFLLLPGTIARPDGTRRANRIQAISTCTGPDSDAGESGVALKPGVRLSTQWPQPLAWKDVASERVRVPPPGGVFLNEALAQHLGAQAGDTLVLRLHKPGLLPSDAAIADQAHSAVALRLKVDAIVPAAEGGDFSLQPRQVPPLNAFVRHDELSRALELEGRANVLLLGQVAHRSKLSPARRLMERIVSWLPRAHPRWPSAHARVLDAARTAWVWSNVLEQVWHPRHTEYDVTARDPRPGAGASAPAGDASDTRALPAPLPAPDAAAWAALAERHVTLQTRRVFLDDRVARAAITPAPQTGFAETAVVLRLRSDDEGDFRRVSAVTNGVPLLTYLANLIRAGERATPYSMVTATTAPYVPPDLRDDEIVVNQWLAEDLSLRPGATVDLSYYVVDSGSALVQRTNQFRVRSIVPLAGMHADRTLMPDFPGIARAERTRDWDTGFPLVHKIREKDEEYWEKHRGTPKAFVTLAAGQAMWASRFGSLTAIRYPLPGAVPGTTMARVVVKNLQATLKAGDVGLPIVAVRHHALQAARQSQDFGGLFLGFSFFLILASLILMGLLFQFGLEQRIREVGTLLALGFEARQVRRLFLAEGIALAAVGGGVGMAGGLGYAHAMLGGLTTLWREAVGTPTLGFHVTPLTLLLGGVASVLVCVVTLWLTLRHHARQPARSLLAGDLGAPARRHDGPQPRALARLGSPAALAGWSCLAGAAALLGWALAGGDAGSAGVFFGAGWLLLLSGMAFVAVWLQRLAKTQPRHGTLTSAALAIRGVSRRRTRSLAVVGLLACGSFLVAAIGAFTLDASRDAGRRSSGTGGFALVGESSLPVVRDLNTAAGRDFYAIDAADLEGVSVVPMRMREGDEASCLNLNRAQRPRLLGVRPTLLAERQAFAFAQVAEGLDRAEGWQLLETRAPGASGSGALSAEAAVPAVGDLASIRWAMGKRVGDTLDYTDERGRPFKVRIVGALANSVLQGHLVIAEDAFVRRFPGESGYRRFLVDASADRVDAVASRLSRALQDTGLELTMASRRLAEFNAVQNTYLGTFQVLGGLGLLLGSAGLGVVVLRNVLERRSELALLLAVGFRRRALRRLVLGEHGCLLALGLALGIGAAFVAILPQWLAPETKMGWRTLGLTLAGVLASGWIWTWVASWFALRGPLIQALRNE
ncbi:MAG: ABC transporter permease [Verrucomicrobia bacterium]|nr:ABC transporter permease [Verrucomicrobiota bacterium]